MHCLLSLRPHAIFDILYPQRLHLLLNTYDLTLKYQLYIIFFTLFAWQSAVFIKYTTTSEHTEHGEHSEHTESVNLCQD